MCGLKFKPTKLKFAFPILYKYSSSEVLHPYSRACRNQVRCRARSAILLLVVLMFLCVECEILNCFKPKILILLCTSPEEHLVTLKPRFPSHTRPAITQPHPRLRKYYATPVETIPRPALSGTRTHQPASCRVQEGFQTVQPI